MSEPSREVAVHNERLVHLSVESKKVFEATNDDVLKLAGLLSVDKESAREKMGRLSRYPRLTKEKKASLVELRPSIHFFEFPHPDLADELAAEESVALLDFDDLCVALEMLPGDKRRVFFDYHLVRWLEDNKLARKLKEAPGNVTLYRWAPDTEYRYGASLTKTPHPAFQEHPEAPISWWRVPAPEFPSEIDQWQMHTGDKLHVRSLDELASEGTIVIDVTDPYSIVFQDLSHVKS